MNLEDLKKAFPIGCEVELIDNQGERYLKLQLGTKGKMIIAVDLLVAFHLMKIGTSL